MRMNVHLNLEIYLLSLAEQVYLFVACIHKCTSSFHLRSVACLLGRHMWLLGHWPVRHIWRPFRYQIIPHSIATPLDLLCWICLLGLIEGRGCVGSCGALTTDLLVELHLAYQTVVAITNCYCSWDEIKESSRACNLHHLMIKKGPQR